MSERRLHDIAGFTLVTADLPRLAGFYRHVLGFEPDGGETPIGSDEMSLLGLSGTGRRQVLMLGAQRMVIDCFETPGRGYPAGGEGDAASLWFQHLALVVADAGAAFARLRDCAAISEGGPQHLPASSGSVHAFKFRDPDGHPLEFLQFAAGKMPAPWKDCRQRPDQIGLGIDHSAISVADADASAAFYRALGLKPGERTLNHGPAQQRLDDLRDVEVTVVPMIPRAGIPHLELLGYHVPVGDRGPVLKPNDVAATRILWHGSRTQLFSDPDGHLQQVV